MFDEVVQASGVSPKKSMMRPWMPTVQSIQELACSKAQSMDTVQLSEATSLCDTGSNLRSRRALQHKQKAGLSAQLTIH